MKEYQSEVPPMKRLSLAVLFLFALTAAIEAAEPEKTLRAGMIGLDTSHCGAFAQVLNDPKAAGDLAGVKLVAAYPGGSWDVPSSWDRVEEYTKDLRKMGVEIVPTIGDLLEKVDVVFLESVDGRPHLAQAIPVILAKKPLFIDKPMAGSLADVLVIFELAKKNNVPVFSSSSLRYGKGLAEARAGSSQFGPIRKCTAWSPMSLEPHHPDLFWYGVHGVEALYTVMGPGCKTVARVAPDKVVGVWSEGREGTFTAQGLDKSPYGALVEGTKGKGIIGQYDGYKPLVVEICKFFKNGKPPVAAEETIELFAFMEGADVSKKQGGQPVAIEEVLAKARQEATKKLEEIAKKQEKAKKS
jgi:predicted dehydrogenase